MSIEANTAEVTYEGDGTSTEFAYPWRFLKSTDLVVAVDGVRLNTGYAVDGAGDTEGGTVTFSVAPVDGAVVLIFRAPPISQLIAFVNNQTVLAKTIDDALDKITMILMEHDRRLDRAIGTSELEPAIDTILPAAEDRPNTVIGFDEDGDLTLLPQTEGNVGSPVVLELGTGALHLSKFGPFTTGASHVTRLQEAFDAAISEGRPLRGFYPDAGLFNCDAPLILRSGLRLDFTGIPATFRRLYTEGSWIEGVFTTPNWDTLTGGADLEDIQEDITLLGVRFDDDNNTRRGSFLTMKCDRLKIQGLHGVKQSAGWTTHFMGVDISIDDVNLDSYDASDDDLPDGTQVWSDTLHFSFVPGLKLTNVRAYAQDDCIAFTLDPSVWATMLPKRDAVSRNIFVGGGLNLRSKMANSIRVGCEPLYGVGALPCDADVAYDNLTVEGIAAYSPIDDHVRVAPIVILEDDRDNATQRHGLITIRNLTGRADVDTGGTSIVQIIGQKSGETADRNFDTVVLDGIAATNGVASSGRKIAASGVRNLVLRNIDLDEDTPSVIPAATGIQTERCDRITVDNVRAKHRSSGGIAAFAYYDELRISDSRFSGGVADAGTDEYDGVYLVPNSGGTLQISNVTVRDAARAFREGATHDDGNVQAQQVKLVDIAFPTLPATLHAALKLSQSDTIGSVGINPVTAATGTPAMTGVITSFNVASILKNGTGDYSINWTAAAPSADYGYEFGNGTAGSLTALLVSNTTSALRILIKDTAGTNTDPTGEFWVRAYTTALRT